MAKNLEYNTIVNNKDDYIDYIYSDEHLIANHVRHIAYHNIKNKKVDEQYYMRDAFYNLLDPNVILYYEYIYVDEKDYCKVASKLASNKKYTTKESRIELNPLPTECIQKEYYEIPEFFDYMYLLIKLMNGLRFKGFNLDNSGGGSDVIRQLVLLFDRYYEKYSIMSNSKRSFSRSNWSSYNYYKKYYLVYAFYNTCHLDTRHKPKELMLSFAKFELGITDKVELENHTTEEMMESLIRGLNINLTKLLSKRDEEEDKSKINSSIKSAEEIREDMKHIKNIIKTKNDKGKLVIKCDYHLD